MLNLIGFEMFTIRSCAGQKLPQYDNKLLESVKLYFARGPDRVEIINRKDRGTEYALVRIDNSLVLFR